jgi:hypothetical protein
MHRIAERYGLSSSSARRGDHRHGSRTHWHTHEVGQVLHVVAGSTAMLHLAVSLGATEWLDEVSDEDYEAALQGA